MGHAFDLQARPAKIQQQAEMQAGSLEIIGTLHPVYVVQSFGGLQLDRQHVIDQQVHELLTNQNVFIAHLCAVLLHR